MHMPVKSVIKVGLWIYEIVSFSVVLFSRWNSWTRPDIAPESGMANVIVGIPTGYIISRDTVEWMYRANFTGLQRIRFYHQKLIMFFSHVSLRGVHAALWSLVGYSRPTHFVSDLTCWFLFCNFFASPPMQRLCNPVMQSGRFVCMSLCLSVCNLISRKKLCMDLREIFIRGRSWPNLKVISFWKWSGLTFTVISR